LADDARLKRLSLPVVAAADLNEGAMVEAAGAAYLYSQSRFLRWSFDGYEPAEPTGPLRLLTPPSVNAAFGAGFSPVLHASAGA